MARTTKKTTVAHTLWQVETNDERPVYVTGNTLELGEWNPNKALQMQHGGRGQTTNQWNISLTLPRGQELEFKFIHKADDGGVTWEAGDNRAFTASDGESKAEWGSFRYS